MWNLCMPFLLVTFTLQFVATCSPEMEAPYSSEEEKMRLLDLYRYMHSRIHSTSRPLKLIYHVAERETLLAWVCCCVTDTLSLSPDTTSEYYLCMSSIIFDTRVVWIYFMDFQRKPFFLNVCLLSCGEFEEDTDVTRLSVHSIWSWRPLA